jgi:hypothetical protein
MLVIGGQAPACETVAGSLWLLLGDRASMSATPASCGARLLYHLWLRPSECQ